MKKEIAETWVNALRSGEYKQVSSHLKIKDGHCCLGVLCEIAPKELGYFNIDGAFEYIDGSGKVIEMRGYIPFPVMKWSGIKTKDARLDKSGPLCLSEMNDSGRSFSEIADIIEKHWEEL